MEDKIDPAFPQTHLHGDGNHTHYHGTSLRQYYAAKAMQGFCANNAHQILDGSDYVKDSVKDAYEIADAMIKFEQNEGK